MATCAVTTSFLGCLVTTYLFFRYGWNLDFSPATKGALFFVFILIGCIPLLISYKLQNVLGSFYPLYRYALYFIYIGSIVLFTLTLLTDAVFMVLSYTPAISSLKAYCCWGNWGNIVVALLLTTYALYAGTKIPEVKTIAIASDKIKQEQTIAVLSDLHIHRTISADKIKGIIEATNAQNPDIILLVGDIIDDEADKIADISALLKGLRSKDGIYFVTGNHEFYAGYKKIVEEMKKLGFAFLENNGVTVNEQLYLAGIPDLFSGSEYGFNADLASAFSESKPEQFRLLMSHTPGDFAEADHFDLEVSGHTHGGQIFPFHIFAKLHNKYLSGLYEMGENSRIYVSNGAGQWGPQMRFLAPAEITIIKLIPKN